jgi:hypothetical protein
MLGGDWDGYWDLQAKTSDLLYMFSYPSYAAVE